MTPKEKAEALVNSYRIILMNEDTECGNEILCTSIAKQCALIAVDEILRSHHNLYGVNNKQVKFYSEVKNEIEKL
jgi:hypothetical protein